MAERVRVGVAGCGIIAQLMHLPYLTEMSDRYEVVALCDRDEATLEQVGSRFGITRRHRELTDLLREPIDAVLILTSGDHSAQIVETIEAGKDVFVEKPVAYTKPGTDAVIAAEKASNRIVMVGMMKRYDPGYVRGAAIAREMGRLRFVDAVNIQPGDSYYLMHQGLCSGISPTPWNAPGVIDFAIRQENILRGEPLDLLREGIGSDDPDLLIAYFVLMLGTIHHIDVIRGVIGDPVRVLDARAWDRGFSFATTLQYPDDVLVRYAFISLPELKHSEETYSFCAPHRRVHIRFPSPYLKNEPTLVDSEEADGEELRVTRITASYTESFRNELVNFHECVTSRRTPLTSTTEFRRNLDVLSEMARMMRVLES